MAGAIVMCLGLYTANFLIMCGGGLILGYAVACLQMYRFAAAELVPIHYRAKAISWVTAGGVAAAVIGPSLVRVTHDLTMPLYLATYAAILGLHVIVFTIMSFISFPADRDDGVGRRPRPKSPHRRARCGRLPASRASSRPSWPACWRSARCPSS